MTIVVSTIAVAAAAARYSTRNFCGRRSPWIAVSSSVHNRNVYYRTVSSTTRESSVTSTVPLVTEIFAEKTSAEVFSRRATTSRFLSSTTDGTVATAGRSRKRPLPWRRQRQRGGSSLPSNIGGGEANDGSTSSGGVEATTLSPLPTNNATTMKSSHNTKNNNDDDENDSSASSLVYPKGKPWRVLWPRPHGEPKSPNLSFLSSLSDFRKQIPSIQQLRRAWSKYRETWEDGITGIPSKHKESDVEGRSTVGSVLSSPTITQQQLEDIGDNAANNLKIVRKDAQDLLEQAKDTTGIRTQDDLKALASEAMIIATECIREFMGGYRKGRDSEIDKMLHQYFQEEEEETNNNNNGDDSKGGPDDKITSATLTNTTTGTTGRKKKRKPKRLISL
jgi:hypothetical protein